MVERVLGNPTTLRFVGLLVLFTASCASMMPDNIVIRRLLGFNGLLNSQFNSSLNFQGCLLAGGWDPDGGYPSNVEAVLDLRNAQARDACMASHVPKVTWWVEVLAIVLLIAATGALYWWLPAWKGRRSRVVPLEEIDHTGELRRLLAELVLTAKLGRAPRFVVDPAAATTSAVVFGRLPRYTVCLHGGLVARWKVDRDGFRGVILHELAHIRNGDVGITYATVALWRVFFVAMLLPYVARQVELLFSDQFFHTDSVFAVYWAGRAPGLTGDVLLSAFMVVLLYLSRADILRSREIYADLAAAGWGADVKGWHHGAHGGADCSKIGNVLTSFTALWRTHPRWDQRRHSLTDPSELFALHALPMFLTGAVAALIAGQLELFPGIYGSTWAVQASTWLAGGLITGIIGVALWRAVTHAVLTARRVPFGLRAGLWFGFGLVASELLQYQTGHNQWLPGRPVVLLVLVLLAVVVTCWTAQCAELWINTWPGRTIRPVVFMGLAVTWVVFAFWLNWWQIDGLPYAIGPLFPDAVKQWLLEEFPGSAVAQSGELSTITAIIPFADVLDYDPLIVWVAAALWLLPLLAWTMPSGTESPRWKRSTLPDAQHLASPELPSLYRVLLAAVLGGVSSWVAVAAVMAYMDPWHVPVNGLYVLIYEAWLLVAVTAGPVATAVVTGAVAARYKLPVALVAAGVAVVIGVAGMSILMAFRWGPSGAWVLIRFLLPHLMGLGVFAAVVAAVLATGVANLVRRLIRYDVHASTQIRRISARQSSLAIRRVCVAVICVAALGLAAATQMVQAQWRSTGQSSLDRQLLNRQFVANSTANSASPRVRKAQMFAWHEFGGADLLISFGRNFVAFSRVFDTIPKEGGINTVSLRSACIDIDQWTRKADVYFSMPDPQVQPIWSKVLTQTKKASTDCQNALEQRNITLLQTSINELLTASDLAMPLAKWFIDQSNDLK
jgi:Zn-dependent protease with chaperone function